MVYMITVIITIVTAILILTTKYEIDTTMIQSELQQVKVMFTKIDKSVDTYLISGGNLNSINFQVLQQGHFLLSNSLIFGTSFGSTMKFNGNDIVWQMIPNPSDLTSYKLMIDMSQNEALMEKPVFSESFIGKEYCEKILFGDFNTLINTYSVGSADFINSNGTTTDGIIGCTVYK